MGASMAWREMSRVVLVKGEQNNSLARFRTKGTGLSLLYSFCNTGRWTGSKHATQEAKDEAKPPPRGWQMKLPEATHHL